MISRECAACGHDQSRYSQTVTELTANVRKFNESIRHSIALLQSAEHVLERRERETASSARVVSKNQEAVHSWISSLKESSRLQQRVHELEAENMRLRSAEKIVADERVLDLEVEVDSLNTALERTQAELNAIRKLYGELKQTQANEMNANQTAKVVMTKNISRVQSRPPNKPPVRELPRRFLPISEDLLEQFDKGKASMRM